MQIQPYLFFNGDCEAAFNFYERCLVGKIEAIKPRCPRPDDDAAQVFDAG
jgi:PhnB protein